MKGPRRFFGTDGIRGRVGVPPITADFVLKLGWAAGRVLAADGEGPIIIGKDTRVSGYMFEAALEAGLSASGVDIRLLGPMPTPAIAYLTQTLHARAGIVISASHNPYFDNGIKFFGADGMKLPDEVEGAIEAELDNEMQTVDSRSLGKAQRVVDAAGRYIEFCKSTIPWGTGLEGLKIVVDCAHGATYHVAPNVFRELGASVTAIGTSPDGYNINDGCGSTQPAALQAMVREHRADVGVALDGDGDRVVMVDHEGEVLDGDELLYIIAKDRHRRGELTGDVVGTVMTNLGLEEALAADGIALQRAQVGDRHVLEMMRARGSILGGETSGHIICLDRQPTGDGITSALQVLVSVLHAGSTLHAVKQGMTKYPQALVNVDRPRPVDVLRIPEIQAAVRAVEAELAGRGRVLLRESGTEPLVRVMVEGRDHGSVDDLARRLAGKVEEVLTRAVN